MKRIWPAALLISLIWLNGCSKNTEVAPKAQSESVAVLAGMWEWEIKEQFSKVRYTFGEDGRGKIERRTDVTSTFVKTFRQELQADGGPLPDDLEAAVQSLKYESLVEIKFTVSSIDANTLGFEYDEPQVQFDIPEDFMTVAERYTGPVTGARLRKSAKDRAFAIGKTYSENYKGSQSRMHFTMTSGTLRLQSLEGVKTPADLTLNKVN